MDTPKVRFSQINETPPGFGYRESIDVYLDDVYVGSMKKAGFFGWEGKTANPKFRKAFKVVDGSDIDQIKRDLQAALIKEALNPDAPGTFVRIKYAVYDASLKVLAVVAFVIGAPLTLMFFIGIVLSLTDDRPSCIADSTQPECRNSFLERQVKRGGQWLTGADKREQREPKTVNRWENYHDSYGLNTDSDGYVRELSSSVSNNNRSYNDRYSARYSCDLRFGREVPECFLTVQAHMINTKHLLTREDSRIISTFPGQFDDPLNFEVKLHVDGELLASHMINDGRQIVLVLDDATIYAMKRGNVLKVETALGSTEFSLIGFTEAYNYVTSLPSLDEQAEELKATNLDDRVVPDEQSVTASQLVQSALAEYEAKLDERVVPDEQLVSVEQLILDEPPDEQAVPDESFTDPMLFPENFLVKLHVDGEVVAAYLVNYGSPAFGIEKPDIYAIQQGTTLKVETALGSQNYSPLEKSLLFINDSPLIVIPPKLIVQNADLYAVVEAIKDPCSPGAERATMKGTIYGWTIVYGDTTRSSTVYLWLLEQMRGSDVELDRQLTKSAKFIKEWIGMKSLASIPLSGFCYLTPAQTDNFAIYWKREDGKVIEVPFNRLVQMSQSGSDTSNWKFLTLQKYAANAYTREEVADLSWNEILEILREYRDIVEGSSSCQGDGKTIKECLSAKADTEQRD